MLRSSDDTPLTPRNGHKLIVVSVNRISGCQKQKEASLDDQFDHGKEVTTELYVGPVEYRVFATTAKGERLDRPVLAEIEAALRSGEVDLLVMEDLGRLIRGAEAVRLLGVGVDHGVRCISPNDGIDTNKPTWEEDALAACSDHVRHCAHTSLRLKHKLMNRWIKAGKTSARPIHGIIVPKGATCYDDWQLDEAANENIVAAAKLLHETLDCTATADWLNQKGVPVGPHCRRTNWNGAMVRRYFCNRLLSGRPSRGTMHTIKNHESGRRGSVKNPKGPQYLCYPHLKHLEPEFQDGLIALLAAANAKYKRPNRNGADPRLGVRRKSTRFPGQHSQCWYCQRQTVWGGNGITGNLMCNGAREYHCWNSIGFSGELATRRLVEVVTTQLYRLDGFDDQYRELVQAAVNDRASGSPERWAELTRQEASMQTERDNVKQAIAQFGPTPLVQEMFDSLQARESALLRERGDLERLRGRCIDVPKSTTEVRAALEAELEQLLGDSPASGALMRLLVPEFHVYLVRLCDGGHLLPRVRVKLDLAGNIADAARVPGLNDLLSLMTTIDLFKPAQREQIREVAARLNDGIRTHAQIAALIAERPTATAVGDALALDKLMHEQGLSSPYIVLREPPSDYPKLRRHKNSKYRFEPLEGYAQPEL
ncbi:MAG: recombinase family protein [Planctomycetes bacterium]|nr:recombinase family protein [Planctomycetota bacterium]